MPALQSILTALGWSLLNSLWQMAVLWIAFYILTAENKRVSATGKHNLALVFVFIGAEWFVYDLIHLLNRPADPPFSGFIPVSDPLNRLVPFLSIVYLLILGFRYLQSAYYYFGKTNRLTTYNSHSAVSVLQAFADRHVRLLGITKRVHVYLSDRVATAETSGFLKPLILLPVSLVTRLSPLQIEAILVHELFHIRRNDYLTNMCMSCIRGVFFFNPFVHLFYDAVAKERELACDDGVVEMGYEPALYAEALYNLEKFRQVIPGFTLAADGNKPWLLMERIRRVLGKPVRKKNRVNKLLIFTGFAAILLFSIEKKLPAAAQSPIVLAKIPAVLTIPVILPELQMQPVEKPAIVISLLKKKSKIKSVPAPRPCVVAEMASSNEPEDQNIAYFADQSIPIDFSNQQDAGLTQDPVQTYEGMPYVPTVSLAYEALPEIVQADSAQNIEWANALKDLATATRIKAIARLNSIARDIENDRAQLKEIEIKNRKLIQLDQKNLGPRLKKTRSQIELRKKEIERLQNRLRISEEEIIHI
jgi:beta-lactamase regulating signal transducer with metallopeptidase domain